MDVVDFTANPPDAGRAGRAILVTSYNTGATRGENVGRAGYSYDFVARLFRPLLERCGRVVVVEDPRRQLDAAAARAREDGLAPVHVAFFPFQDVTFAAEAPNVVVPAWEYPDVPDHAFDANPQNDWVATAGRCNLILVGGEYTRDVFARAGIRAPVRVVPVPTPGAYFDVGPNDFGGPFALGPPAYAFGPRERADGPAPPGRPAAGRRLVTRMALGAARRLHRRGLRHLLPGSIERRLRAAARGTLAGWRNPDHFLPIPDREFATPRDKAEGAILSGVVFTSIINPADGRKNWEDMITAFLHAFRDREDATLLVKLINGSPFWIEMVLGFYEGCGIGHRCRLVFVSDFLSDEQMVQLLRQSTYYVTTTRAEGNCLPLMNAMAAGRPAVSPRHTAISDYFGVDTGFVVRSSPEPTAWPQDSRLRRLTTWHRLDWQDLVDQLRHAYDVAKHDRELYESLASAGRGAMLGRASAGAVLPRLRAALDLISAPAGGSARAA